MLGASPAGVHSFVFDTRPGQGERPSSSPEKVVLQFTEAVASNGINILLP